MWIEGGSDIASEHYASVILDRSEKKLLAMVSARAGWTSRRSPRRTPTPWSSATSTRPGVDLAAAREIVAEAGLDEDVRDQAAEVLVKLAEVATSEDATLIEVNPLIVTADRQVARSTPR